MVRWIIVVRKILITIYRTHASYLRVISNIRENVIKYSADVLNECMLDK